MALLVTSAVILMFCSSAPLLADFAAALDDPLEPEARSCPAPGDAVPRPPAAPGGVAALAALEAGGAALSALNAPLPEDETAIPAPGEIWLEALSRLLPLPCPVSISFSKAVICRELPYRNGYA